MMTDLIVLSSIVFAVAFSVAWMVSPRLRAWIERPKHRFQDAVQGYDRSQREPDPPRRSMPRDRRP